MSSLVIYLNNFICGAVVAILVYYLGAGTISSILPSPLNAPIIALAIMGGVICLVAHFILDRILVMTSSV